MELNTLVAMVTHVIEAVLGFVAKETEFSAITKLKNHDVTRRFDLVAEQTLQDELLSRGISARIVSEEWGDRVVGDDPQCTFVFDPVDGSTNVAIGFPYFCSSLAYAPKTDAVTLNDVTMGVVVTNSLDTYAAVWGEGACSGAAPLATKRGVRHKPVIAGYGYGVPHVPQGLIEFEKRSIVRIFGSVAYDLCQVAAGVLDAVIVTRGRLSSYDIAAAQLIVREAHGFVTATDGSPLDVSVTATNLSLVSSSDRTLHNTIIETLRQFSEN
ncbi:MAG TPA: inositol monophosphatase family protein [Candidatus Bathyarchaeia archaeon]|nr:inositol monophosphatase family protein [Candidatus Bathyarchaeia archaeon]